MSEGASVKNLKIVGIRPEPNRRYGVLRDTGRWAVTMSKDDYRQRAAECLQLANEAGNPTHRAALLEMAQAWLLLHDQAEKNRLNDISYETPLPRAADLDDSPTQ